VPFYPGFALSHALIGMAGLILAGGAWAGGATAPSKSMPAAATSATSMPAAAPAEGPATAPAAIPAGPSACQVRLSAGRAVFKPLGDLTGPPNSGCGAPDGVLLQRIILDDRTEVAVEPPATMRCEMAEAITEFVRNDLAPAAAALGSPLRSVENYDSFDCRSRNGVAGAKLSEHGLANALDIRSIRLKDGRVIHPTDADASLVFRTAMKAAACERFTTVLGPGSDGYHEDHIHLDRIERRSGYRMCQWDVRDEPKFALQSVSARSDSTKSDSTKSAAAAPSPGAVSAALRGPVPLPRPNPFRAARVVVLPAESHHR
jgi:hypothetical protein